MQVHKMHFHCIIKPREEECCPFLPQRDSKLLITDVRDQLPLPDVKNRPLLSEAAEWNRGWISLNHQQEAESEVCQLCGSNVGNNVSRLT